MQLSVYFLCPVYLLFFLISYAGGLSLNYASWVTGFFNPFSVSLDSFNVSMSLLNFTLNLWLSLSPHQSYISVTLGITQTFISWTLISFYFIFLILCVFFKLLELFDEVHDFFLILCYLSNSHLQAFPQDWLLAYIFILFVFLQWGLSMWALFFSSVSDMNQPSCSRIEDVCAWQGNWASSLEMANVECS